MPTQRPDFEFGFSRVKVQPTQSLRAARQRACTSALPLRLPLKKPPAALGMSPCGMSTVAFSLITMFAKPHVHLVRKRRHTEIDTSIQRRASEYSINC